MPQEPKKKRQSGQREKMKSRAAKGRAYVRDYHARQNYQPKKQEPKKESSNIITKFFDFLKREYQQQTPPQQQTPQYEPQGPPISAASPEVQQRQRYQDALKDAGIRHGPAPKRPPEPYPAQYQHDEKQGLGPTPPLMMATPDAIPQPPGPRDQRYQDALKDAGIRHGPAPKRPLPPFPDHYYADPGGPGDAKSDNPRWLPQAPAPIPQPPAPDNGHLNFDNGHASGPLPPPPLPPTPGSIPQPPAPDIPAPDFGGTSAPMPPPPLPDLPAISGGGRSGWGPNPHPILEEFRSNPPQLDIARQGLWQPPLEPIPRQQPLLTLEELLIPLAHLIATGGQPRQDIFR